MASGTAGSATVSVEGRLLAVREDGLVQIPCTRCASEDGHISSYRHVQGGVCFLCYGEAGPWVTVADATATFRRRDADKARRDARRAAKLEKAELAAAAMLNAHPAIADLAEPQEHALLADLRFKLYRDGTLSDKQIALAERILNDLANAAARRAAEDAAKRPAPTGLVDVVGEILSIKIQDSPYGYDRIETKMLVKADGGYTVWGTLPAAICRAERGDRITFTATLTASNDDPSFAFARRPRAGRLLEERT